MELVRTNSDHPEFQKLVRQLDSTLAALDGDDAEFYASFNKTAGLQHVVLLLEKGTGISCGALRPLEPGVMEVKRMFTLPEHRGNGFARQILAGLEQWAREEGCPVCRLETGKRQPDAIALYEKCGYRRIPNYGQYAGMENSVCFEKFV